MRVVLANLTGGRLSDGYQKYLRYMIPLMGRDERIKQLNVLVPGAYIDMFRSSNFHAGPFTEIGVIAGSSHLKTELARLHPDVIFIPTARFIRSNGIPTIIMVQNMEALTRPIGKNTARDSLKNIGRLLLARKACRQAERIIAISGFVREFLLHRWKIDAEKVGVVYHGVEAPHDPAYDRRPPALEGLQESSFIFTAGAIRAYRGLEDAIQALGRRAVVRRNLSLVIAGKPDTGSEAYYRYLVKRARETEVGERVLWTGHLERDELAWCYRNCSLFIMTSRVEACPNTALEAMAYSCLIISTRNPPMPEFFQDAAFYYNEGDAAGLAQQVEHALALPTSTKNARKEACRHIAERLRWQETARLTVDQFFSALHQ
jgi:glycosyltransferase involved in cell wall biosynthesis